MKFSLDQALARLATRAFYAREWAEPVIRRFHRMAGNETSPSHVKLRPLYDWILVPPTLWPFNISDALNTCLAILETGAHLSPQQLLLIDLLPPPPSEAICTAVAEHERHVQSGSYEDLLKTQAKFTQTELTLKSEPLLLSQWQQIKAHFDVPTYQDHKGVLRRTMGAERNLRPDFSMNLAQPVAAFQAAFDAFCLRWQLYGMQHDEPLLLKLTVNLTPHGTMILIPAYWSFDPARDIKWSAIAKLHRTRVPNRQGATLAEGELVRRKQAAKLRKLDAQALKRKLTGPAKHAFLCAGIGWVPETSPRRFSRLRNEFKR